MNLLLDTHIWLWSLTAEEKLSRRVAHAIANQRNDLWLSPVSIWEVSMLGRKGRLDFGKSPEAWVTDALLEMPLRDAALTREVALAISGLRLPHRDPADTLIAATARAYGLTLATADRNLLAGHGFSVLPND